MKTNKRAISLIVLVITIIVLAILATTVIVTITNSGIIGRAEETMKMYELKQVKELANLAFSEALLDEDVRTSGNYQEYIENYLRSRVENLDEYTIIASSSGVSVTTAYKGLTINGDTAGARFYCYDDGNEVEITDASRKNNPQEGDWVVYGDYVYELYDYGNDDDYDYDGMAWYVYLATDAYSKENVGELCGNICGYPMINMYETFEEYTNEEGELVSSAIVKSPQIPSSVIYMEGTFSGCTSLTQAPTIPSSVVNMWGTFSGCTGLTEAPTIPSSVTGMYCTFEDCTNLKGELVINANPEYYYGCFAGAALTEDTLYLSGSSTMLEELLNTADLTESNIKIKGSDAIYITLSTPGVTFTKEDGVTAGDPNNIEDGDIVKYGDYEYKYNYSWYAGSGDGWLYSQEQNGWGVATGNSNREKSSYGEICTLIFGEPVVSASWAFAYCNNMTEAPTIPSSVVNMEGTFYVCGSLTKAPTIPSSVENMSHTFYSCTDLTGIVQINSSSVSSCIGCFDNNDNVTVKVPAGSTTYTNFNEVYGTRITIETFN